MRTDRRCAFDISCMYADREVSILTAQRLVESFGELTSRISGCCFGWANS